MAFSHIECPDAPQPWPPQLESQSKSRESLTSLYNHSISKGYSDHTRQLSCESAGVESPDSPTQGQPFHFPHSDHSRNPSSNYTYASEPMDRQETIKPIIRRRARGDSSSSAASFWSSAAISGDANYRDEMLLEEANRESHIALSLNYLKTLLW
jgi:hypothetical protein